MGMNCFLFNAASGCPVLRCELPCPWVEEHTPFMCEADFYDLEPGETPVLGFVFQAQ